MNKKQRNIKSKILNKESWLVILFKKTDAFGRLILTVAGALIGLTLTNLFVVVVLASVYISIFGNQAQAPLLLQLTLSAVGTTLGGFIGYLSGRKSTSKKTD